MHGFQYVQRRDVVSQKGGQHQGLCWILGLEDAKGCVTPAIQ